MSAIEDIKKEIVQRHQVPIPNNEPKKSEKADKKPKGEKKAMTKAEIEAYKQKMIEREEAMYLGKESKDSRKQVKKVKQREPKPSKSDSKQDAKQKKEQKKAPDKAVPKRAKAEVPRILQPLEPLYLLRIPGLPKGDCIAICYARGADA